MIKVIKEGNYIVFENVRRNYDYDIFIDDIKADGLEKWVRHLQEKNWFTKRLEVDFINLLSTNL